MNHLSKIASLDADEMKIDKTKRQISSDSTCVIFPPKIFRVLEKPLHEFQGHSVTCVDFNPLNDNYFISGSIDGKVRIWEVLGCQVVDYTVIREIVTAVSFRPDGKGKKKLTGRRITGFEFSPSDPTKVVVSSADSIVRVLNGMDVICKFRVSSIGIAANQMSASFTTDGKHVVSTSEDSNVYIWNYNNQEKSASQAKNIHSYESFSLKMYRLQYLGAALKMGQEHLYPHTCLFCFGHDGEQIGKFVENFKLMDEEAAKIDVANVPQHMAKSKGCLIGRVVSLQLIVSGYVLDHSMDECKHGIPEEVMSMALIYKLSWETHPSLLERLIIGIYENEGVLNHGNIAARVVVSKGAGYARQNTAVVSELQMVFARRENYPIWSIKMHAYLKAYDLWDVEETGKDPAPLSDNPTLAQIKQHGEESCKFVATPLVLNEKLEKEDGIANVDATVYGNLVGSLLYLTTTRPNLIFLTSLLSRYNATPSQKHYSAAKEFLELSTLASFTFGSTGVTLWMLIPVYSWGKKLAAELSTLASFTFRSTGTLWMHIPVIPGVKNLLQCFMVLTNSPPSLNVSSSGSMVIRWSPPVSGLKLNVDASILATQSSTSHGVLFMTIMLNWVSLMFNLREIFLKFSKHLCLERRADNRVAHLLAAHAHAVCGQERFGANSQFPSAVLEAAAVVIAA
ncbi:hypothetical protein GH714_007279 [Hevea brasiliensis]|uniref:DUF4219 domain-containing protein n=1 Tax=Hevea brasiliensis TaxID=3981 RepID=A0A6A6L9A2_HEVBR|nr:hypothetical protein GH714_007279 [Hevea brasiliensis]